MTTPREAVDLMLSIGRLWRRAPAWRLLLVVAVACTALAAMFPPATPRWAYPAVTASIASAVPAARFVPQPGPPPPTYATTEQPPLGTPRAGVVGMAGRQVPMPEGGWQTVFLARAADPAAMQVQVMARIADHALTGLAALSASDPLRASLPPALVVQPCDATGTIAADSAAISPDNPFARECWTLGSAQVSLDRGPIQPGHISMPGLDRLKAMGVRVPTRMLVMRYSRSDQSSWFAAMMLLPESPAPTPAARRRLVAWARRYGQLLHRGYDGTLPSATLVKDPA